MTSSGYGGYPARPAGLYPITRGIVDLTGIDETLTHVHQMFDDNLAAPFVGVTTDGNARTELFPLTATGLSTSEITRRARSFLDTLDEAQKATVQLALDANERRAWINAFSARPPHGLLLDDLDQSQRDAAVEVLASAMSERGFHEVRTMMRINAALAEVAGGYEDTLKEWMYWFAIFGDPSDSQPWAFQIFGHHMCVNVYVHDDHLVLGPMFLGAEPRVVLSGPETGVSAFDAELSLGLELMRALDQNQQQQALLAPSLAWDALPPELAHPTEGRMRASAARDNAVIPYEGVSGAGMNEAQRSRLRSLLVHYADRLPSAFAALQTADIDRHLDETHFAWAGEVADGKPFYYKVHSPVLIVEIDAHSGIFIGNDDPEPFHIHNILRIPNGNDYGRAYLDQARPRR